MSVHPTAIVDPSAAIHPSVEIGPYSLVEGGVAIGADCVLESCVRIYAGTRMGRHNRVHHDAVLGALPQHLTFDPGIATGLEIGDHNRFREFVSVHRATAPGGVTRIGNHNYLMAYAHVAHDCTLGDRNIFVNYAGLAGHVAIDHDILLSAHVSVHQFCRVGAYALIAGLSGVPRDVPPFVTVDGHRAEIVGLNLVGLKRAGFSPQRRNAIKRAYKTLYRSGHVQSQALEILESDPQADVQGIVRFVRASQRGILGHR